MRHPACAARQGTLYDGAGFDDMERKMQGREGVMIRALGKINPSHLLEPKPFDFVARQKMETGSAGARGAAGSAPNSLPPSKAPSVEAVFVETLVMGVGQLCEHDRVDRSEHS